MSTFRPWQRRRDTERCRDQLQTRGQTHQWLPPRTRSCLLNALRDVLRLTAQTAPSIVFVSQVRSYLYRLILLQFSPLWRGYQPQSRSCLVARDTSTESRNCLASRLHLPAQQLKLTTYPAANQSVALDTLQHLTFRMGVEHFQSTSCNGFSAVAKSIALRSASQKRLPATKYALSLLILLLLCYVLPAIHRLEIGTIALGDSRPASSRYITNFPLHYEAQWKTVYCSYTHRVAHCLPHHLYKFQQSTRLTICYNSRA